MRARERVVFVFFSVFVLSLHPDPNLPLIRARERVVFVFVFVFVIAWFLFLYPDLNLPPMRGRERVELSGLRLLIRAGLSD